MLIPIAVNQGGKWRIGETETDFPKEKPADAHLYSGHATALQIFNYEGRRLTLQTPEYSYLELTDNREWNWSVFGFRCATPLADRKELTFTIRFTEPETGKGHPLVDKFGQSTREDWPQKVKSEEELKADVKTQAAWLDSFTRPRSTPSAACRRAAKNSASRRPASSGVFLEEYFRLISESFRRHDPHHLLLGCRLQPGTINNEQLCRIAGKYVDVMSFNYYTMGVDKEFLRRIYGWTGGRPMMMSEFYWGASKESGLAGGREVATQKERGLAYRNYVEQCASLGFVVGIEWFTLIDQSVTGRWFQGYDGERANTGVLAVTDRPWQPMLAEMIKTNYGIYEVLLGREKPFVSNDPRFKNTP